MTGASQVVVVGGGVIGCAVAYYAAKRGLDVTLVDQPKRGRATSASAGGLWPLGESLGLGCGVIFHRASREQGREAAGGPALLPESFLQFALRSNSMFPDLASELRELGGVDFELESTSLLFLLYDEADETYARSLCALRPDLFSSDDWLGPEEVRRREPALTRDLRGALQFRGDDQVNPYRLADALRSGARRLGARILTHTEVTGLEVERGRLTAVQTLTERIPCSVAVNAAGAWAAAIGRTAGLEIPVRPVRGQIVSTNALPEILRSCVSTSDCYLAQKLHGELIVGSTTEEVGFDPGVTPSALRSLCRGAVRAVPLLESVRVKRAWSGLRPGTPDELPILGPVEDLEGYLNACGHFRTGILNAPLTGLVIAALAEGKPSPHPIGAFRLDRFSPTRAAPGPERPAADDLGAA